MPPITPPSQFSRGKRGGPPGRDGQSRRPSRRATTPHVFPQTPNRRSSISEGEGGFRKSRKFSVSRTEKVHAPVRYGGRPSGGRRPFVRGRKKRDFPGLIILCPGEYKLYLNRKTTPENELFAKQIETLLEGNPQHPTVAILDTKTGTWQLGEDGTQKAFPEGTLVFHIRKNEKPSRN